MGIFFRRSRAANSAGGGLIRPKFELVQALMHVIIITLPVSMKRTDEKQPRKSGDTVFSIITIWELSVAIETRVLIRSGPKPDAAFPQTQ